MMERSLRLADMLPMQVSTLDAHDWICSSARVEAKYTNPVPTTGPITVKFVERLVEDGVHDLCSRF